MEIVKCQEMFLRELPSAQLIKGEIYCIVLSLCRG